MTVKCLRSTSIQYGYFIYMKEKKSMAYEYACKYGHMLWVTPKFKKKKSLQEF